MSQIDLNTYELFFIDFVDGNLSSDEINDLNMFLDQHPDLKEEFELFNNFSASKTNIPFYSKRSLKKELVSQSDQESNFDNLCVAYIEKDLNESEQAEFIEFCNEEKEREKTLKLFSLTKLLPNESIVYQGKQKLKHQISKEKPFGIFLRITAVAASIALLVIIYVLSNSKQSLISSKTSIVQNQPVQFNKSTANQDNVRTEVVVEKLVNNKNRPIQPDIAIHDNAVDAKLDSKQLELRLKFEPLEAKNIAVYLVHVKNEIVLDNLYVQYEIIQSNEQSERINFNMFLIQTFNKQVFNKEKKSKIELFDIAQASVERISKWTGSKMSLERVYDEKGAIKMTEFNSRFIAFSSPSKNN